MSNQVETSIHPTAIVHPNARLAQGVQVGPYSIIGEHVSIGEGTVVGPHVVIEGHTTIGRDNRIFQFASLGSQPQDLKFHGEPSTLEIGDRNQIREYVTMNPGTEGGGMLTRVGSDNLLMVSVHIAHDCIVGNRNVFANLATLAGHVIVDDEVILGGACGVHQFVRVGRGAMLAGAAMVNMDVAPYCMAQGDRATLRGLNVVGMRRRGGTVEDVRAMKQAYRIAFREGLLLKDAIERIRAELGANAYVERFVAFLAESERGVTRPASTALQGEPEGVA